MKGNKVKPKSKVDISKKELKEIQEGIIYGRAQFDVRWNYYLTPFLTFF